MSCLTHNKKKLAAYAAAGAAVLGANSVADADWTGSYAHANWTFSNLGANGGSVSNQTTTTLSLTSGDLGIGSGTGVNDGMGGAGTSQYTITAAGTGLVTYDWTMTTGDTGHWDYHGHVLNGVYTVLGDNGGPANGSASFAVNLGDTFGLWVHTRDGAFGGLTANFSNFFAPEAIPEPTAAALLALGTVAGLGLRRRRS